MAAPALFDAQPELILEVQDFGDESRCVTSDGRIIKRFSGWKHQDRAHEYVHAFTEGFNFHKEQRHGDC